jgi:hypothetical protein
VKLFAGEIVMVEDAVAPARAVTVDGFAVMLKSGAFTELNVGVTVWIREPLVPVILTV